MQIDRNCLVVFEYVLRDEDGNLVEASRIDESPSYIHGYRQLIPGLERQMEGHEPGDRFTCEVKPQEAYGMRDDSLVVTVPLSEIPDEVELKIGDSFDAVNEQGHTIKLQVKSIGDSDVLLDANHALAGKTLHYDITIKDVHPATEQELMEVGEPLFGIEDPNLDKSKN